MKGATSFRILASLDNDTAAKQELHVDIQLLDENFAILLVNEKTEIVSNSGTSR